jgi:hypothetical protein
MQAPQDNSHQPDLSFNQTYAPGGTLPPPVSFLPSQQGTRMSTPNYQQQSPFPPPIHNQGVSNYGGTAPPGYANLAHPPMFGGPPSMTVGRPMQYDQMYLQIQALRQQNEAHDSGFSRQAALRNSMAPSSAPRSFGVSGPLTRGFDQTQGHSSSVSRPRICCTC